MKKWFLLLASVLILLSSSACGKNRSDVPELLEPVGVRMDIVQVKKETISSLRMYAGEVVPYVEQLQFPIDGVLQETKVTLGEQVAKGQVLAVLSEEKLLDQIRELEEAIEQTQTLGDFSDRLAQADIDIAKAELERILAWGGGSQNRKLKELEIRKLEQALQQAKELRTMQLTQQQEKLDSLREQVGKNLLTAPCDGQIVYLGLPDVGGAVQGYRTVICISDATKQYIQTEFISNAAVEGFEQIRCKIGGQEYALTYIPYDVQAYLQQSYLGEKMKTRFLVQTNGQQLEIGEFAAVLVTEKYKENVLTVPINALYTEGGISYVYQIVDGTRVHSNVTVGIVTELQAEITAGLQEGDLVYVKE